MKVEIIATEALGDRSYVVHDGTTAAVIDPQRDLDRVDAVLAEHGLTVALVCETHRHNDYVTGGYALAQRTGARYLVPAPEDVVCDHYPVRDGETFPVGELTLTAVATRGHTDGHTSYVVRGADGASAVFTGGSLLYGSVGRTDLVDPSRTEEFTRAQYRGVRRLVEGLPGETAVYPTHGFGSFCSSGAATGGDTSTVAAERAHNEALVSDDEDSFVAKLIAGLTAFPAYYAHMGERNKMGPGEADLSPVAPVDPDEVRKRIAGGEWVVDLRDRSVYATGHVAGTVSIALGTSFSTYLGWVLPWGEPITLIGESPDQIAEAQRQLVRIGIERLAGQNTASLAELAGDAELRAYPRMTFADLAARSPRPVVLDVRRDDERAAGGIDGSLHIPLHSLLSRMDEVPDAPLWVHCAAGFRASIGASLLDRAGHEVVLIDDDYANSVSLGLASG